MKLAVYTIGRLEVPSTRFRILQYLPYFEKEGIEVRVFSLPSPRGGKLVQGWGILTQAFVRLWQFSFLKKYDVILIQKGLTPWRCRGLLRLLVKSGKPFIYDIDDAVYLENDLRLPVFLRVLQDDGEPLKLIRAAAHVIAGNPHLADFAGNHNSRLTIIPTAIDTEKYSIGIPEQSPGLVIGWSGSSSTNTFVNQLIPVLNRLAETHRFTFHVISNDVRNIRTGEMKGFEFRFFEWNDRTEVENLKKIHVGVMPLKDDPWARGKCALKALQYMALALPTVVSPVGVNTNIIQDGVNGFLAGPPNEWYGKLKCLLDSSELRQRVGRAARATVEKGYSLQVNFSLFRKVLENPESSANPKRPLETAGRS